MTVPKRIDLQLLKWSDTSNGGKTVTFQLCDDDALEYFKQYTLKKGKVAGQLFATAFQIADDQADEPSDSTGQLAKEPTGQNCRRAISLCKDGDFWKFLDAEYGATGVTSPHYAGIWLKKFLCIKSRRELDDSDRPELGAALWDISVEFDEWYARVNK